MGAVGAFGGGDDFRRSARGAFGALGGGEGLIAANCSSSSLFADLLGTLKPKYWVLRLGRQLCSRLLT